MWLQAMIVHAIIMTLLPVLFTKPTGIQFIDDIVLYTNTNKQFILQSSIIVGLSVYAADRYINSTQ